MPCRRTSFLSTVLGQLDSQRAFTSLKRKSELLDNFREREYVYVFTNCLMSTPPPPFSRPHRPASHTTHRTHIRIHHRSYSHYYYTPPPHPHPEQFLFARPLNETLLRPLKSGRCRICSTGWRTLIRSPKLQIIFHKRAIKYRSLLRKMTYKDKGSYESSPPCIKKVSDMHLSDMHLKCLSDTFLIHCNTLQRTATHCNTLTNCISDTFLSTPSKRDEMHIRLKETKKYAYPRCQISKRDVSFMQKRRLF